MTTKEKVTLAVHKMMVYAAQMELREEHEVNGEYLSSLYLDDEASGMEWIIGYTQPDMDSNWIYAALLPLDNARKTSALEFWNGADGASHAGIMVKMHSTTSDLLVIADALYSYIAHVSAMVRWD